MQGRLVPRTSSIAPSQYASLDERGFSSSWRPRHSEAVKYQKGCKRVSNLGTIHSLSFLSALSFFSLAAATNSLNVSSSLPFRNAGRNLWADLPNKSL